jgi:hypothetical protein
MDPLAHANELRNQRAEFTHKILEVQLALAKIRRAWLVDGQQTPIAVRVSLEYDIAELELKRHTIDRELALAEKIRREAYAATFVSRLTATIQEMGLGHVLEQVRKTLAAEARTSVSQADQAQSTPPDAPAVQ